MIVVAVICAIAIPLSSSSSSAQKSSGSSVLYEVPLIDGHNDLPHNLYKLLNNQLKSFHFENNNTIDPLWGPLNHTHTDLARLKEGRVGAQFWVAFVTCPTQHKDAVERTMQQIDVIKRLIQKYPNDLQYATTADGEKKLICR